MKFETINNFVVNHTGAQFFEADFRLYKKTLPHSKLIPELERAPEYARKNLDERMIYEILSSESACIDCIWENRGFFVNEKEEVKELTKSVNPETEVAEPVIIGIPPVEINPDTAKYNELKQFVFEKGLQDNCPDNKAETYRRVIKEYCFAQDNTKKKEIQGPSIPE